MAFNKKYIGLPDLDPDPDVYETPELTDEVSTQPTTTVRTAASNSDEEVDSDSDIDHHGINADEARARFLGATVDSRNVNFSDSITKKRRTYRNKNRRRRGGMDTDGGGSEYVGDFSDDEEGESLERKLARLRREVDELKDEFASRKADTDADRKDGTGSQAEADDGVLELSRALDELHASARGVGGPQTVATALSQRLASFGSLTAHSTTNTTTTKKDLNHSTANAELPSSSPNAPSGILTHAAAFDSRLALMEASMGISSSSNPFIIDGISQPALRPVLPALDRLTSRLSALTSILVGPTPGPAAQSASSTPTTAFSTPHLESLTSRVRKLTSDAEALESARQRATDAGAKAAQTARVAAAAVAPPPSGDEDVSATFPTQPLPPNPQMDPTAIQNEEQAAKIQALYATLPTIQSLHPLLPGVLERLRSLRAVHAGAAQAAESLDEVERRQMEMKREVEQWREGLKVVEEKMGQGEVSMRSNIEIVEPWVRDLESRLNRLESSGGGDY